MKPRRILSDAEKIVRSRGYVATTDIDNVKRYILNGAQYDSKQGKAKIACPKALSETSFVTFDATPDMLYNGKSSKGSASIILPAGSVQITKQKDGRSFEGSISSHDLAMSYAEQLDIEHNTEVKAPKIPSAKSTANEIVVKYNTTKEAHISKKNKAVESEFGDIVKQSGALASELEISK